jgi:hypothetical protein
VADVDAKLLQRSWVHAHEEDTQDTLVFRPAGYSLPPSRGRTGLELRPDGTYAEAAIGPTDRPEESDGTWRLEGNRLELAGSEGGRVLEVVSAEGDRLVVRRP